MQLYTSGRVQSTLLTQTNQWLKSSTITILTLFMPTITVIITCHQHVLTVGVLCTAITDEGSRRLPKLLKIVHLLASVNEPQSCVWDVCECLHGCIHVCVCVYKCESFTVCGVYDSVLMWTSLCICLPLPPCEVSSRLCGPWGTDVVPSIYINYWLCIVWARSTSYMQQHVCVANAQCVCVCVCVCVSVRVCTSVHKCELFTIYLWCVCVYMWKLYAYLCLYHHVKFAASYVSPERLTCLL